MTTSGHQRATLATLATGILICAGPTVQRLEAQTAISVDGVVESTSGGLKFPDGSVQMAAATAGSAPVERTGQTKCYDAAGTERACAGTGEDGEFQAGVAWPPQRFTDNGDGTVTDNLTGLVWLKDANCPGVGKMWQDGLDWVADLNTMSIACTDYTAMTFTDWRLPNLRELLSLLDFGQFGPALPSGHPFANVQTVAGGSFYLTSTTVQGIFNGVWTVPVSSGNSAGSAGSKTAFANFVWPVRSGHGQMAAAVAGPAPVEDTGQVQCYDAAGTERACAGTGEDGEFQAGVARPTPRFTDNGDGTVTDTLTALIWLKDANCPGAMQWQAALDWVADLNTMSIPCTDYAAMTFTDWRLPNLRELLSLMDSGQAVPALPSGHPFANVQSTFADSFYHTSTSQESDPTGNWGVQLVSGNIGGGANGKTLFSSYVWPVRGGQ